VQHALRAFTAKDQKGLKLAAETYRPNPDFAIDEAIRDVGTGEAVTSFLEAKGIPGVAERTLIRPPSSQVGPLDDAERAAVMAASPVRGKYDTMPWTAKAHGKSCAHVPRQGGTEAAKRESRLPKRASSNVPAAMTARPTPRKNRRRTSNSRSDSVTDGLCQKLCAPAWAASPVRR
jgi:uncharacterized protein